MSTIPFKEGKAPFNYEEGRYETYFKVYGDLKNHDKSMRPIVILHGGPGLTVIYLLHLSDLASLYNIPVVLYDQIGCGQSTHLPEKGANFWTPDLMCDQLEQLLKHLGINGSFDLFGHSWGGILATYFAGTRRPPGLVRLVLNGSPASIPLCVESVMGLLKKLPERIQNEIWKHEEREPYDEAIFAEGCQMWLEQHVCMTKPFPDLMSEALKDHAKDPTVNNYMESDLEFYITGTIKDITLIPLLPAIKQPTLVINGEYDMCQDSCVKPFIDHMPKVKWVHMTGCSHTPFFESREKFMKIVGEFLLA